MVMQRPSNAGVPFPAAEPPLDCAERVHTDMDIGADVNADIYADADADEDADVGMQT